MKQQDRKKMQSLYEQWLESGKSRAGFAKSHGIAANTFNYWINKFQGRPLAKKAGNFNRLSLSTPILVNTSNPTAIIHFPSGAKIELYNQPEVSFLKELVF
jgi:transposase-like protein